MKKGIYLILNLGVTDPLSAYWYLFANTLMVRDDHGRYRFKHAADAEEAVIQYGSDGPWEFDEGADGWMAQYMGE